MSSFLTAAVAGNVATLATYGESVTYTTALGVATVVTVVWDDSLSAQRPERTTDTAWGTAAVLLTAAKGDTLTRGLKVYTIAYDPLPDSTGGIYLHLRYLRAAP